MAISHDVDVVSNRTGTTDPHTWTHTPGANAKGIAVGVSHGVTATAHCQTVTYGGLPLTLIVEAADTATEPGNAQLWFLGKNLASRASDTVSADLDAATTDDILFVSWTFNGAGDLEVVSFGEINENAANPTVALESFGRLMCCVCMMYGGGAAPGGTPATGVTVDGTQDFTAFYGQSAHDTTPGSVDFTIGWSTLGTDDLAFTAMSVAERPPRQPVLNHQNPGYL